MGGAFAETDGLRQIDSGDIGVAADIEQMRQDDAPTEQSIIDGGATLQQALGADALADAPLPQPRARATRETIPREDDRPVSAVSRPVGRAAVGEAVGDTNQTPRAADEPKPAEAAGAESEAADTAGDAPEEDGQPELAAGYGDGDNGGPDEPTLETGEAPEEPEDGKQKGDGDLYKYDEEKDFTPDPRLRPLPQSSLGMYGRTVLDHPETEVIAAEQQVELAKDIEAGLFAGRLLEVLDGTADLSEMDAAEAAKLTAAAQRYSGRREELEEMAGVGREAKDAMITHNLKLSYDLAKAQGYGLQGRSVDEPMDLVTRANDGLISAVERFDYTLGYTFSTYATPRIKQAMQRGRHQEERTVRLPVYIEEDIASVSRVERTLLSRLRPGEEVTADAIAAEVDMTPERVEELMLLRKQSFSLNQNTPGSDTHEYIERVMIEDETDEGLTHGAHADPTARAALEYADAEYAHIKDDLQDVLGHDPKLYQTIVLRFGLFGHAPHTLEQAAAQQGVVKETVRTWERRALEKLRSAENIERFERFL